MRAKMSLLLSMLILMVAVQPAAAQSSSQIEPINTPSVLYMLVEGSTLVVDWGTPVPVEPGVAKPPVLVLPITGKFSLLPVPVIDSTVEFLHFAVSNLEFRPTNYPNFWGHDGKGKYLLSKNNVDPQRQRMSLKMAIDKCAPIYFESGYVPVPEGIEFPWIDIKLAQIQPGSVTNICPRFTLRLVAVPKPRVWFSTEVPHTSGSLGMLKVGHGDLLCAAGWIVRTNRKLLEGFKPYPASIKDFGLDSVTGFVLKPSPDQVSNLKAQVWFSTEVDLKTQSPYGVLYHGDLLSDQAYVVRRNKQLIQPFSPMPPVPDLGLDATALYQDPTGTSKISILFSTESNFFSEKLGKLVSHGDLLHQAGRIFKTNAQLMANFHPVATPLDGFGLDAAYVWPDGEVWFSTEIGFKDNIWGMVGHGDLLSDRGFVIARNRKLMKPFEPLEDLADFGLDALWIDTRPLIETCGVLVKGAECVLFRADSGGLYVLENYAGFSVGGRVLVSGILDPTCMTICMQGNGCILENQISKCPEDTPTLTR